MNLFWQTFISTKNVNSTISTFNFSEEHLLEEQVNNIQCVRERKIAVSKTQVTVSLLETYTNTYIVLLLCT